MNGVRQQSEQFEKIFIIDVMAMAFRNHHAFARRPLKTSKGFETSAIFGSANYLLKLIEEERPDYLVLTSDVKGKTFRHDLYPEYKANRSEMPESLGLQIPEIFRMFSEWGLPFMKMEGFEADDLIGSIVTQYGGDDCHSYIVSGDKDFLQLLNSHTYLYSPKKGGKNLLLSEEDVFERFKCKPEFVIDILALWGDSADNVPGVPGIGEKGAAKLAAEFGNLDSLYGNLDEVKNKRLREKLVEFKEQAYLSRDLVTIKTDIALPLTLEDCRVDVRQLLGSQKVADFFQEMEFFSLRDRVLKNNSSEAQKLEDENQSSAQMSHGGQNEGLEPGGPNSGQKILESLNDLLIVRSLDDLLTFKEAVEDSDVFVFDTETTGLDIVSDKPIGLSVSLPSRQHFYVPIDDIHRSSQLSKAQVLECLVDLFASKNKLKIAHNLKFDIQMLSNLEIPVSEPFGDTMLMAFVSDSTKKSYSIDNLSHEYLGVKKIPTSDLIGKKGQISMLDVELSTLAHYACEDTLCCLELYELLSNDLLEGKLNSVYAKIDVPLIPILAKMEQDGITVKADILTSTSDVLNTDLLRCKKQIYEIAGEEFNINSPKQLQEIIFTKLKIHDQVGLKRLKKTKSGYSTDVSVLESLSEHPLPRLLLEYRSLSKLKSTYVDALPQLINPKSNRIHTSFHQSGTATGRLSSSHPNLQNIPIRSKKGREIRKAFVGREDWVLVSADYSQIELRILAHMANDKALIRAFHSGADIHTATAAEMFKIPVAEVGSEERAKAKAINYGIIYGMGPQRLAKSTGVSLKEAKNFINKYFETFESVRSFIDSRVELVENLGYSETICGRRRTIEGLDGSLGAIAKVNARNIAVNSPIQGSAADLMKIGMIRVQEAISKGKIGARMLLQVHDEVVLECSKDDQDRLVNLLRDELEHAMDLLVPLKVDIGVGSNWLEAH